MILASQFGAGQPTEGLGWELSAIASVVVGGTLLTGGLGSIGGTFAGALLLGLIFNMLNFEKRPGRHQPQFVLAVGDSRRLFAFGRAVTKPVGAERQTLKVGLERRT